MQESQIQVNYSISVLLMHLHAVIDPNRNQVVLLLITLLVLREQILPQTSQY